MSKVARRALIEASRGLQLAALGHGTDCDPLADAVNATVIELVDAVRKGAPDSKLNELIRALTSSVEPLRSCLERVT
jgi:hypothetical protein